MNSDRYIVKFAIAGVEHQFLNYLFNKMQKELMQKLKENGVNVNGGVFYITLEYRSRVINIEGKMK